MEQSDAFHIKRWWPESSYIRAGLRKNLQDAPIFYHNPYVSIHTWFIDSYFHT